MDAIRRSVLKAAGVAGALAGGLLGSWSALAAAWNKDAFAAKTPADAQKAVGGSGAAESRDIVIEAPQIAENGAVVPIEVMSNLPGTTSIAVLVDKNPFPLVGQFEFMPARCRSSSSMSRWARLRTCGCWSAPAARTTSPSRK